MSEAFVTQLKFPMTYDVAKLQQDLKTALDQQWHAHYNPKDYSGDWDLIALMSSGGKSEWINAMPIAGVTVENTEIMENCPYFREVLESLPFEKTSVRLMRLRVGAEIKPHKDYCLGYEDGAFRMHIPVITNPDVEFILAGKRLIMEEGTCWYINANEEHSVANRGTEDRVHLVIDGKRNEWTDQLFFAEADESQFQRPPKPLSDTEKRQVIEALKLMEEPAAIALREKLEKELNESV